MKVRIEIESGDSVLTQRQNSDLDAMLAVVMGNIHLPAVSSFHEMCTPRSFHTGYQVTGPEQP